MKNRIKVLNMHVHFHFFKGVTKRLPSFIKSGSRRELQSYWIQLKIYLNSPYYNLSKWWSRFYYLSKSHHRNLTTKYTIKKPTETVRCLDSTHLPLTFWGNYSSQNEQAFWAWMHLPRHLFKTSSFFETQSCVLKIQRDFALDSKMYPYLW